MNSTKLPQFLFVGTAKAGTTSIYHYLSQHPDIEIPLKESFYFIDDDSMRGILPYPFQRKLEDITTSLASYTQHYQHLPKDAVVGEIGTGYLYCHKQAIARIKETLGTDVKICIILRDPKDRAWSAYSHFKKDLHEPLTFNEAVLEEPKRAQLHWDFMWQYTALGFYASQVEAYQNAFANVKVWKYEELAENPQQLLNELCAFIGAKPYQFDTAQRFNQSAAPRFKVLQKLVTHESIFKRIARPIFRALFGKERRRSIRKFVRNKNEQKKQGMPAEIARQLNTLYYSDVEHLEKLLKRDLSAWRATR